MALDLAGAVVLGLAAYRIAHATAREDGPWDLFSSLRERVGQGNWIGRGLHCALCTSFWSPWPLLALWLWAGTVGHILVVGLAASGVGLLIHGLVHGMPNAD